MTVDELFRREPWQWGMRGDPHVWRAIAARVRGRPLPDNVFALRSLVEQEFREVVGLPLTDGRDEVHVPAFATGSGMSDGVVSLAWWRRTGLPILIDRWGGATASEPTGPATLPVE